jgi:hypothetical protein
LMICSLSYQLHILHCLLVSYAKKICTYYMFIYLFHMQRKISIWYMLICLLANIKFWLFFSYHWLNCSLFIVYLFHMQRKNFYMILLLLLFAFNSTTSKFANKNALIAT